MSRYMSNFAGASWTKLPQTSIEIKDPGVSNESVKVQSPSEGKGEGSSKANIARVALAGLLLLGASFSAYRQFSQQNKTLVDLRAACQKNYDERVQQCTTFQQWCTQRNAPKHILDFLANNPAYDKEFNGLKANFERATAQQEFLESSPMIACFNYRAFVNTESNGIPNGRGMTLHDKIHPFAQPFPTTEALQEHCVQTTPNHCPDVNT